MSGNALWASLHFVSAFGCVGALAAEWSLWQRALDAARVRRLFRTDLIYGIAALALFGTGAVRAAYFEKGWDYYSGHPLFWTKVGIYFLIVGLSLPPTLTYFRLAKEAKQGLPLEVTDALWARVRLFLVLEMLALMIVPIVASTLARG